MYTYVVTLLCYPKSNEQRLPGKEQRPSRYSGLVQRGYIHSRILCPVNTKHIINTEIIFYCWFLQVSTGYYWLSWLRDQIITGYYKLFLVITGYCVTLQLIACYYGSLHDIMYCSYVTIRHYTLVIDVVTAHSNRFFFFSYT